MVCSDHVLLLLVSKDCDERTKNKVELESKKKNMVKLESKNEENVKLESILFFTSYSQSTRVVLEP